MGKTIGVRFHLICPKETKIRFDAYKGVNGPNFYEAYVVGYVEHTFPAGRSAFDFYFKDAGVEKPETVQGFGVINCEDYRIPSQIGFSKLELIFAKKEDAAEFELAPIRLTAEILKARGIDLRRQVGKIPNEELDRRCWRGFHLSAMGEQISYWRLLLKSLKLKDNESQKLEKQRKSLIRKIEQGKLDDAELNKLQGKVDLFINKCKQTIPVGKRRMVSGLRQSFSLPGWPSI